MTKITFAIQERGTDSCLTKDVEWENVPNVDDLVELDPRDSFLQEVQVSEIEPNPDGSVAVRFIVEPAVFNHCVEVLQFQREWRLAA